MKNIFFIKNYNLTLDRIILTSFVIIKQFNYFRYLITTENLYSMQLNTPKSPNTEIHLIQTILITTYDSTIPVD